MSLKSIVETIGKDLEKVLADGLKLAVIAEPLITVADPVFGIAFSTTVGVILQTKQKFAALGKLTGTEEQQVNEITAILGPALGQLLAADGKIADSAAVEKYINGVLAVLGTASEKKS
jgi:hypothetical protein